MSTPTIKYTTRCQVPGCVTEFHKSPLDIPIMGKPHQQVIEFVAALYSHLQKRHPEQLAEAGGLIQQFTGLLVLSMFAIEDPKLQGTKEHVRYLIHRLTRRNYIQNSTIDSKLAELGYDPGSIEGKELQTLIRDMRNILSEEGEYAPKTEPAPLVTV